jgi:hypothetical protein
MTSDDRFTWGLIVDVFDVLERHGYHKYDNQHTGRAFGMIRDLAYVYGGARETHPGPVAPSPHPEPASHGPGADQEAIILTHTDVSAVFAAADIAATHKRYRVEDVPRLPRLVLSACRTHRDAEAFDQMADRHPGARTAPDAHHGDAGPPLNPARTPTGVASDQPRRHPANPDGAAKPSAPGP